MGDKQQSLEAIVEPQIIAPGFEYAIIKIPGKNDIYIVRTNAKDQIDYSKLEKYVQGYRAKQGLKENIESINELNRLIAQYVKGGEIAELNEYLISCGYPPSKILEGREASNMIEQAVAYTDRESIIGVSNQFNKNTEKMARQARTKRETAKYLAIMHEFIHTAQNISNKDMIADEKYYRTNAEYEAEMLCTGLLYRKAAATVDKEQKEDFLRAAQFTFHRAKVLEEYARRRQIPLAKQDKLYDIVLSNKEIYEANNRSVAYVNSAKPPLEDILLSARGSQYIQPAMNSLII